jgi:hypothetical protein
LAVRIDICQIICKKVNQEDLFVASNEVPCGATLALTLPEVEVVIFSGAEALFVASNEVPCGATLALTLPEVVSAGLSSPLICASTGVVAYPKDTQNIPSIKLILSFIQLPT